MTEKYAILDQAAGHLVNVVLWDGDLSKWTPPTGTTAVRLADIDLATLPPAPAPELPATTAEEFLASVGLGGERQPTLLYLRQSLAAAGKQCEELDAVEGYLQMILSMFAADQSPRSDWPVPSVGFEQAVSAAMSKITTT
jgi:hypothetical protein